jgi:hypothetical protein
VAFVEDRRTRFILRGKGSVNEWNWHELTFFVRQIYPWFVVDINLRMPIWTSTKRNNPISSRIVQFHRRKLKLTRATTFITV